MASAGAAVIIDEGLLAAVRERAQRVGRPESELVEEALRRYLGLDGLLEQIWAGSPDDLSEQESLELAYSELRAARAERS